MIIEALGMVMLCVAGMALLHARNLRGTILVPLGFLLGTAVYCTVGTFQIVLRLPTYPALTALVTLGVGVAPWFAVHRTRSMRTYALQMLLVVLGVAICVALLRKLGLVGWHSDSFRYMQAGKLIGANRMDLVTSDLIEKRMAAFPILLAPGVLLNETHLKSLGPLLGLATLWLFGWLLNEAMRRRGSQPGAPEMDLTGAPGSSPMSLTERIVCVAVAALLLVSNNRFLWNLSYINGHMLFAANLLVLSGCGWFRVRYAAIPAVACVLLMSGAAIVIALVRPEGALVSILALLPFLCSTQVSRLERVAPVMALGGMLVAWYLHLAAVRMQLGSSVPASTLGMVAMGGLLLVLAPLSQHRVLSRLLPYVPHATEIGLWLALAAFALKRPQLLRDSVHATIGNVVNNTASWGSSLVVLCALVVLVFAFTRLSDRQFLRFPITTFIPLAFVLTYLRDGAYRDGDRDSLARMLFHFVPLTVFLIATTVAAEWRPLRAFSRRTRELRVESITEMRGAPPD